MTDKTNSDKYKIEERLRNALKRLDLTSQFLLQSLFGVLGCNGLSCQRVAQKEKVSQGTIEGLQADALRALMGYGPKAPKVHDQHQSTANKEAVTSDIPDFLN